MSTDYNGIPIPTIKRLPSYLRLLKAYREEGMEMISATLLADELGLKPIQVRKDISCTGIEGKPKVGFSVNGLIDAIIEALGWDNATDAILVGVGHLGSALARYEGFENYGLKIAAALTPMRRSGVRRSAGTDPQPPQMGSYIRRTTSSPSSPFRLSTPRRSPIKWWGMGYGPSGTSPPRI